MNWEYKGVYKTINMEGIVRLPNDSKVQVCDWTEELPEFMKEADTIFIDPPWNIGNVNTFYFKADRQYVKLDFIHFSEILLNRIIEISPRTLFIEMGKQFLGWYLERCKEMYKYVTFYNSTYYKKNQNKCYVIQATNISKVRRYKELEDQDEQDIIEWICKNHQYECIGDLCMGMGLVGKYAYLSGKKFVGTELNKKRLALLVDFIRKQEHGKLELLGKDLSAA
jgi:hypothetical protein